MEKAFRFNVNNRNVIFLDNPFRSIAIMKFESK